jgi:hypothetical protein
LFNVLCKPFIKIVSGMRHLLFVLFLLCFFSCNNKTSEGAERTAIYADYNITAEEGGDTATCLFTFYDGGTREASLFLEAPASISLDGTRIPGDSAGLSGAYYELRKPLEGFAGTHTIVFKNEMGKTYTETFRFQPFRLVTKLGEAVTRAPITLQLTGLQPTDYLRVLLTDTSFVSADINETDTVRNGQLVISREALRNIASGPVTLHLFKEEERRLRHPPDGGGKLSLTYGLSREFNLEDK